MNEGTKLAAAFGLLGWQRNWWEDRRTLPLTLEVKKPCSEERMKWQNRLLLQA